VTPVLEAALLLLLRVIGCLTRDNSAKLYCTASGIVPGGRLGPE
jgi:hypothetical protein